jgi:hypothetical protein
VIVSYVIQQSSLNYRDTHRHMRLEYDNGEQTTLKRGDLGIFEVSIPAFV